MAGLAPVAVLRLLLRSGVDSGNMDLDLGSSTVERCSSDCACWDLICGMDVVGDGGGFRALRRRGISRSISDLVGGGFRKANSRGDRPKTTIFHRDHASTQPLGPHFGARVHPRKGKDHTFLEDPLQSTDEEETHGDIVAQNKQKVHYQHGRCLCTRPTKRSNNKKSRRFTNCKSASTTTSTLGYLAQPRLLVHTHHF